MTDFVTLDIGGTIFKTRRQTLLKFPSTRLGKMASGLHNVEAVPFDRNQIIFSNILDFYRLGELHLPKNMCAAVIVKELDFWEIDQSYISECCLKLLTDYEDSVQKQLELKKRLEDVEVDYSPEALQQSKVKQVSRQIWLFFDCPKSSNLAFMYSILFMVVTALSVTLFCMETHPDFRDQFQTVNDIIFLMNYTNLFDNVDFQNPKEILYSTTILKPELYYLQISCLVFFTIDLLFHFGSCPNKRMFFRSFLNVLDWFLVISMWTTFLMELNSVWNSGQVAHIFYIVFKCLTAFRMLRLLRLIRQHNGLNMLFMAIRSSKWEIGLLFAAFMIFSTVFGGFVYYAEYKEHTTFPHAFTGIWWSIVTMTTVGYGDEYPKSFSGKIVGSFCAISGVLIIAMPIAIIASTFSDFNDKNKVRMKHQSYKKRGNKVGVHTVEANEKSDLKF